MQIKVDSSAPIRMTVDAAEFGNLFCKMNSEEQVAVMRSIVEAMKAFPLQWDFIALEMGDPKNDDLRRELANIITDMDGVFE